MKDIYRTQKCEKVEYYAMQKSHLLKNSIKFNHAYKKELKEKNFENVSLKQFFND